MAVCSECIISPRQIKRRICVAGLVAAAGILCFGLTPANAQSGSRIGPSGGTVAGAAIGIGAGVAVVAAVAISHSHHTLTGCVFDGANGMKLKAGDSKVYSLEGDAASVKAGEKVKLHGSHLKKAKGANGDPAFRVEKLSKDYGPCHVDGAQ